MDEVSRKKAVPPPTIFLLGLDEGAGRGVLIREYPGGVATESCAKVEDELIHVSVSANMLIGCV